MTFAKKSLSFVLASIMAVTSLFIGTTAFAADKKTFTAMTGDVQAVSAIVKDDTSTGNHKYTVDGTTYYTYTPAATGYYAVSIATTPIYAHEDATTGTTTYSYSQIAASDSRVDSASFSIYEKYNANTDELTEYVRSGSTDNYTATYTQAAAGKTPEEATKGYVNGYATARLIGGTTYYFEVYNNYESNAVAGTTNGEKTFLSGAVLSIAKTDWTAYQSGNYEEVTFYVTQSDGTVKAEQYPTAPTYSVKYVGAGSDVVVPDTVNGFKVTSVTGTTNENITSLTLNGNVKSVSGFSYLKKLASVNLANVEELGSFSGDTALTYVNIPGTVEKIDDSTFYGCAALAGVTLNSGTKTIGSDAFYNTALTAVVIPTTVTSIGDYAFGYYTDYDLNTVDPVDTTPTLVSNFKMGGYNSEAANYATVNGIAYYDMTNGCPHPYNVTTTASTLFKKGKKTSVCPLCGAAKTSSIKKKKIAISSLKKGKKSLTVKTKKYTGVKKYQIQVSTSKKFTKKTTKTVTVKSSKALNKKVKGLKSGKKYYVRVRAYNGTGKKAAKSAWSKVKSVKVK